jgi:hypothetical protein
MRNEAQVHVDGMDEDDLEKLILTLGNYTKNRSRELSWIWRSGNPEDLPKSEEPKSIVSLAFKRVLTPHSENGRKWNPETHPNFQGYMMDVIDSILDEFANCFDNKSVTNIAPEISMDTIVPVNVVRPQGVKKENHKTGRREQAGDWLNRQPTTPEDDFINKEKAQREASYLNKLAREISADEELVKIYEAIRDGCSSNQEIKHYTGLEIKDVENAKKRLKTQINKLKKEFIKENKTVTADIRR